MANPNDHKIEARVQAFVQELEVLIRQSVIDTLQGALGGTATMPRRRGRPAGTARRGRPAGRGGPRGRRPSAEVEGAGPKIVTDQTRQTMRQILKDIQDGTFARAWIAENEQGRPQFAATRAKEQTQVLEQGQPVPPPGTHRDQVLPGALRDEWGDYVWWDARTSSPKSICRDEVGTRSSVADPQLEGAVEVQ